MPAGRAGIRSEANANAGLNHDHAADLHGHLGLAAALGVRGRGVALDSEGIGPCLAVDISRIGTAERKRERRRVTGQRPWLTVTLEEQHAAGLAGGIGARDFDRQRLVHIGIGGGNGDAGNNWIGRQGDGVTENDQTREETKGQGMPAVHGTSPDIGCYGWPWVGRPGQDGSNSRLG